MPSPSYLLLLLLLLITTTAASATSESTSSAACKSSFYPKLCRALLSTLKLPSNPYDYGRYSVKQALKQAHRTATLLDGYLARGGIRGGSPLPAAGRGALDDCRQLAALNTDYLSAVQAELGPGGMVLERTGVDRVRAMMSALLTNQQTCYDGLEASRSFPELYGSFLDETKLYGLSLELVTSALEVKKGGGSTGAAAGSGERYFIGLIGA